VYALPQNRILELVRLSHGDNENLLEDFYGTPVYRLREKLVPVLYLNEELKLCKATTSHDASINMVVVQSSGIQFGLIVDKIFNIQDVVVKPLGPLLNSLSKYAGATILGSGRVSLILDVDGIATESGLVGRIQAKPIPSQELAIQIAEEEVSMLLFELPGITRIALPLEDIEHILMLGSTHFQENGDKEVVFYQNQLMHVIRLQDYVSGSHAINEVDGSVSPVLTCNISQKIFALVVKQVHDIIQVPVKIYEPSSPQRGIKGCVIFKDEVINVLDLEEVIAMHNAYDSTTIYPRVIDIQGAIE